MRLRLFPLLLFALLVLAGCSTSLDAYPWRTLDGHPPLIIAHRGDSGNFPEHTLLGYESALKLGADFIEPDIVLTKDAVPVCRHDLYLGTTTDVAQHPEFSMRQGELYGRTDWFAHDFTLAELKSLQAIQSFGQRNPADKARQHVPLLSEVLELTNRAHDAEHEAGLYIEIKKPAEHRALGLDPSKAVHDLITSFRHAGDCPPVVIQCFDHAETARLAKLFHDPVVYLSSDPIDFDKLPEGISGLGLNKKLIKLVDGRSELIEQAHGRGLFVHVWTFRDDQLEGTGFENGQAEIQAYLQAGVDGVFTDFPATGIAARQALFDRWQAEKNARNDQPLSQHIRENSPRRYLRLH